MKKLLTVSAIILLFGAGAALAQPNYQFAPAGTKDFTTEETISVNDTISLDLWLKDAGATPQTSGGAWIDFSGSTAKISYVSAGRALTNGSEGITGNWDPAAGAFVNEPLGLVGIVLMVNVNLAGAAPDVDGDQLVGTITLQCTAGGDAIVNLTTIPETPTWGPISDASIVPGILTIHQQQTCTQDSECDDGLFCNGVETCDVGVTDLCLTGTPPVCDDGVDCTDDSCNEGTDSCDNVPDDGNCTDNDFCTGVETCDPENVDSDPVTGCLAGDDPCPDDGLFCTGEESCLGAPFNRCESAGNPCTPPEECIEESDQCVIPPCEVAIVPPSTVVFTFEEFQFATTSSGVCDPPCYTWEITNQESTGSMIVGAGTNDSTGVYTAGSGPGTDTITVTDACNGIAAEATVTVEEQPCTSDEECDDGVFCNGAETCDIDGTDLCQGGEPIECDDGVACTEDSCNEVTDSCDNVPDNANCPDDGENCNGTEICDAELGCTSTGDPCPVDTVCVEGDPYQCVGCLTDVDCDDSNDCTTDTCNLGNNTCVNTPVEEGTECDDGRYCTETDTCSDNGVCVGIGNPCPSSKPRCSEGAEGPICKSNPPPPPPGCTTDEACDDNNDCTDDTCENSKCVYTDVTAGTACDDGLYCTATDTCEAGVCQGTGSPCTASTTCDEENQSCNCTEDAECDDGVYCNGAETCDGTCQDGTPVECPDDGVYCNGVESCNEEAEACVSSGNPCAEGEKCDEDTDTCDATGIDATLTFGCGRAFSYWFGVVQIQGTGIEFTSLGSIPQYQSLPPVVKIPPKLLNSSENTITQFLLLFPSFGPNFFQLWNYPATVTVTVNELSATFEIPACSQ